MRKRDRRELDRYVRWVANEIGLRDWTLEVVIDQPAVDDGRDASKWGASCAPVVGRKYATLTFAPWHRRETRESLRETVVHELVHCHLFGVWDTCRSDTLTHLGQATYDVFISSVERHMEYGVDAIAEALAPHMPLIDWPD